MDFTKADLFQVIKEDGSTASVKLFDHAKKVGGTLGVASGMFTFEDNGIQTFDRVTPWVEEYLIARRREQLPHVTWWAWDHLALLRWAAMPLPSERAWAWRRRLGRAA